MMAALIGHLGWTLLHFIWQGALIACLAGVGLTALRNSRPQARYLLACLALLACLLWPAAGLLARLTGGDGAGDVLFSIGAVAGTAEALPSTPVAWLQAHLATIVALWAACTCALSLRMTLGLWWIDRAARAGKPDQAWQARLDNLASRFGITRTVRLAIIDGIASPLTAGWWRPLVLLPSSLVSGMPAELLEALLAHELAHIARADYLVNLLQNLVETMLFYHPAVWWLSRRIRVEREQIADDLAAQLVGQRRLALALSELEKNHFAVQSMALTANGGELMNRITRLLRPARQGLHWKAALPLLGLSVALAAGCAQLPAAPSAAANVVPVRTSAVPQFKSCVKPMYPADAFQNGVTGTVNLVFLVNRDGKVIDSRVNHSSGSTSLDETARLAIAKCAFTPAMENGQARESWTPIQYVWTLE